MKNFETYHRSHTKIHQRGFSLVVAVSILAFLAFLGTVTFNLVTADIADTGGFRTHTASLSIAQTGMMWGEQRLNTILYNGTTTPDPSRLAAFPALSGNNTLCAYSPYPCSQWYLISDNTTQTFSNGFYQVAATCVPGPCSTNPNSSTNYLVRSLGYNTSGALKFPRLLESTMQP